MPNYQNGKIYCLRSHQTNKIYIGSTTQSLSHRKGEHKQAYKKHLEGKGYNITSLNITKFDDWYIELIEYFPCTSREELHKREGELIREMNCVNKVIAGRTQKEYRKDNEQKLKEYMQWDSIEIEINLKLGNDAFKCYTCDFTHDYININADYRN